MGVNQIPAYLTGKRTSNNNRRRMTIYFNRREGFTFVELMIVVTIIAVLVAIAVPIYESTIHMVRERTDDANVRILNSATLQWVLANDTNDPRNETTETLEPELAPYLMEWPVSPNGKAYVLDDGLWKVE
jgi:type IV pilus assembly protein PilA